MGSSIKKWETQNKGWYNAVKIINKPDATVLQFEYKATTQKGVETQFCELGELTYVAESYFRSSIKLLSEVEKIDITKDYKYNYNLSFYFLPAMFCFRHYVELKMKIVYLDIKKDEFIFNHELQCLRDKIESLGFTKHCFDDAIALIDSYEKGQVEFFRYLLGKDCVFTKTFDIQKGLKEKIKNIHDSIEYWSSLYFSNKLIKECLNNET